MTEPSQTERPLGARYRLNQPDGTWWELGWDRPLGTYYAQHHSPIPYDPFTPNQLLAWHGTDLRELPTVEALAASLPVPIPGDIADELRLDSKTHPHLQDPPLPASARQVVSLDREMGTGVGADAPSREPAPAPDEPAVFDVTRYQQTGVLAVDQSGAVTRVDDVTELADPASEYHFTFKQVGHLQLVDSGLTPAAFREGCPPGHDADPRLVSIADTLDVLQPGTDMLRFTEPSTGAEQWIGRDTPFDAWQTWDDPRQYYVGDPSDIIDETEQPAAVDCVTTATAHIAVGRTIKPDPPDLNL